MSAIRKALAACAAPLVRTEGEEGFCRDYHPGADFVGFAGHFPGQPILPAVVQVLMAEMTIALALGRDTPTGLVRHAKFMHPLHPGSTITCQVTPQDAKGGCWECRLLLGERLASSFRWYPLATTPE